MIRRQKSFSGTTEKAIARVRATTKRDSEEPIFDKIDQAYDFNATLSVTVFLPVKTIS
jgi:hypothetical protein